MTPDAAAAVAAAAAAAAAAPLWAGAAAEAAVHQKDYSTTLDEAVAAAQTDYLTAARSRLMAAVRTGFPTAARSRQMAAAAQMGFLLVGRSRHLVEVVVAAQTDLR